MINVLRAVWRWLTRDIVSSVGHAVFACAIVMAGWQFLGWLPGGSGATAGWGVAVGFYARRELLDLWRVMDVQIVTSIRWLGGSIVSRVLQTLRGADWKLIGMMAADCWLDFMFPLVAASLLLTVLT